MPPPLASSAAARLVEVRKQLERAISDTSTMASLSCFDSVKTQTQR